MYSNEFLTGIIMLNTLNILDCLTTYYALKIGAMEGNPVFNWMLNKNVYAAYGIKIILILVLSFGFDYIGSLKCLMMLMSCVGLMFAVVMSNILTINSLLKRW
jgi:hypothetical protein